MTCPGSQSKRVAAVTQIQMSPALQHLCFVVSTPRQALASCEGLVSGNR